MPATESASLLLFESSALAPETFDVVDFSGEERISRPFHFEINLVSDDEAVDLAAVINQPATLTVHRGLEAVPLHGIVADFQQGGHAAGRYAYRAVLVPHLWRLSLSYQSRVFQNMTVEEIVSDVLSQGGVTDYRFELKASYEPREYCVQYRETDLDFIGRLLEHEGIRYFFEHGDKDVLVLMDDLGTSPRIPGEDTVAYNVGGSLAAASESVREFICRERVVTGKVVLKDYNYQTPETLLQSESQLNGEMPGLYYEYGQHFKDQSEGDRLAQVRNEEIECQRRVMSGDSDCGGLRSGHLFTLKGHYRGGLNGDYLLTEVHHYGTQGASLPGLDGAEGSVYRNEFTCIPASVSYRPPRLTPIPRIPGIMTAKVETAGGEYAYIDEMGRYRVKMPFDLSDEGDGQASPPVRMAQPYSGGGYGMHFPNHAGTEMVWACMDGDVDRPLGLSTVPNPSQSSPVSGGNKTVNMIKTASDNVIAMDDTKGSEQMNLSTPYNNSISCGNDQTITVGNNQTISVATDRSKTVGANQTEDVGANKTITVGGNHSETIGGAMSHNVGGSRTESVGTVYALTIGAAMNEAVGAAKAVEVGGPLAVTVGAVSTESVGGSKSITAASNIALTAGASFNGKSGGKMELSAGPEVAVKASKVTIMAGSKITLKCGGSTIEISGGSIKIKSPKVEVSGSGSVTVKGAKVTAQASAKTTVKGAMVSVEASGINTIKGSLVKIN